MTFFRNMKIGAKLFAGFSIIILFMGFIGLSGLYSVRTIETNIDEIFSRRLPSIDYLIEADRDLQQLLVAERSMIFSNAKSPEFKSLVEDYETNLKQANDRWEKYKALATSEAERAILPKYEAARQEWMTVSRQVVDGRIADTREGRRVALDLTLGQASEKFEVMRDYIDQLTQINLEIAGKNHHDAAKMYESTIVFILGFSAVGLVIGIGLMIVIGRGVTVPLKNVVNGLTDISQGEGDLTKRLEVTGQDEIGALSGAFNDFIGKLQAMIQDISKNIGTLSEASAGLFSISEKMSQESHQASEKSQSIAKAAGDMSASMVSISSSMAESSTNTNTIASAAEEMNSTVNEIAKNAETGRRISDEAVSKVKISTLKMDDLGRAAQAIGKVVETITDISEQVNLLSLNATIEAARAGEAGKGFAVVANEIKDLAGQTSAASMDIKEKIENIQSSSDVTLTGINEISEVISQLNDIVANIAASVEEQSSVTREISQNINQVSGGIQEVNENVGISSRTVEDITAEISQFSRTSTEMRDRSEMIKESSTGLSQIAEALGEMVGRFKV